MEGGTEMSTTIRAELSKKNKYWIERHRYYELKHFCLQYPIWKKAYTAMNSIPCSWPKTVSIHKTNNVSNPTLRCAEVLMYYSDRMDMVERIAKETAPELANYILKAVTEGISYTHLKTRLNIPCCKDVYYNLYRRFFWLLNKERQ